MEIPDKIKVKIFFKIENELRYFYYFTMNKDNLYWGHGKKISVLSHNHKTIEPGKNLSIELPKYTDKEEKIDFKHSYHSSGETHCKETTSSSIKYTNTRIWPIKKEIRSPKMIYALITSHISEYPVYTKNPQSGNTHAICIDLKRSNGFPIIDKRFYFDFHLSPEGKYLLEKPLVKFPDEWTFGWITHSLSQEMILVIRFCQILTQNDVNGKFEIGFQRDNL